MQNTVTQTHQQKAVGHAVSTVRAVHTRWPELMSITTLAEYLDMSVSSVRRLVRDGALPPACTAHTPRLQRWKRSNIDSFLTKMSDRNRATVPSMDSAIQTMMAATRAVN